MSDTPRTDAIIDDDDTLGHKLARFVVLSTTLERELAAAQADARRLNNCITLLGDAATDLMEQATKCHFIDDHGHDLLMNKAMFDLKDALECADAMREEKP
jgi:hypothetical protein